LTTTLFQRIGTSFCLFLLHLFSIFFFLFLSSSLMWSLSLHLISFLPVFFSLSLNIHGVMLLKFLLFFLIKEHFLKSQVHHSSNFIIDFFLFVFIVSETSVSNFTIDFFFLDVFTVCETLAYSFFLINLLYSKL